MSPLSATPGLTPSARSIQGVALVVCDLGDLVVGVHVPNVARILEIPAPIHFPRPRPLLGTLIRIESGLAPMIDLNGVLGLPPVVGPRHMVLVSDKDVEFGFPVRGIESVIQLRVDRINYPRPGETTFDHELVRGFWTYRNRRKAYIINGAAVYHKVVGDVGAVPAQTAENAV